MNNKFFINFVALVVFCATPLVASENTSSLAKQPQGQKRKHVNTAPKKVIESLYGKFGAQSIARAFFDDPDIYPVVLESYWRMVIKPLQVFTCAKPPRSWRDRRKEVSELSIFSSLKDEQLSDGAKKILEDNHGVTRVIGVLIGSYIITPITKEEQQAVISVRQEYDQIYEGQDRRRDEHGEF